MDCSQSDPFVPKKGGLYGNATPNVVHGLMLAHKLLVTVLRQDMYKTERILQLL